MRPHLTTLNCGLGRDSIAMLCLLAERQLMVDGEHVGPEAVDAVLFADTGAEWPRIAERRPAPLQVAPIEHPQLFEGTP